jgi:hypothetical protein
MGMFDITRGVGTRGGLTIQICESGKDAYAAAPSLSFSDDAFSFVVPILKRRAAAWVPYARWGLTEIDAESWRLVVQDLRAFAERIAGDAALSEEDVTAVPLVDLDTDTELDAAAFRAQFQEPRHRDAICGFLTGVADWVDDGLTRNDVLTVCGV